MTTTSTAAQKQQHNSHLIEELQKERQQVWSLYCHVAELKPFSFNQATLDTLTQFSQLLIDYISLGHFGIYEKLIANNDQTKLLSKAKALYADFSKTTDAAVEFNDKYDQSNNKINVNTLEQDLSNLGVNLAKRIEMEDQLCHLLQH